MTVSIVDLISELSSVFFEGMSGTVAPSCAQEAETEERIKVKYKECPFCGGEAHLVVEKVCFGHGEYATEYTVRCCNCHTRGPSFDTWEYSLEACKFHAEEAWNNRTVTQDE